MQHTKIHQIIITVAARDALEPCTREEGTASRTRDGITTREPGLVCLHPGTSRHTNPTQLVSEVRLCASAVPGEEEDLIVLCGVSWGDWCVWIFFLSIGLTCCLLMNFLSHCLFTSISFLYLFTFIFDGFIPKGLVCLYSICFFFIKFLPVVVC